MLEQILELVKQQGQQSVVENQNVPNNLNNQVMAEAASTITGGLQNILSGGGLQGILSLFGQGQGKSSNLLSNPVVAMMVGHLANNLVKKMNLSPAVANGISNNLIPGVLNNLVSRTVSNAPQDNGFNIGSLIGAFTGGGQQSSGGGIDLQGLLNQFTQGGQQQQQSSGLESLINTITQKAQNNQQSQSQQGGGLADLIQGFFK